MRAERLRFGDWTLNAPARRLAGRGTRPSATPADPPLARTRADCVCM